MHKKPKEPFQYRPLTEGLGLNHFADGLPYSPLNSSKKPPIRFQYPPESMLGSAKKDEIKTINQADQNISSVGLLRKFFTFIVDFSLATLAFYFVLYFGLMWNGFVLADLSTNPLSSLYLCLGLFYAVVMLSYFLIQKNVLRITIGQILLYKKV